MTVLPPLVEPAAVLGPEELRRYSRQVVIPGVGVDGQRRLGSARVLVIGAGGLGSPVLLYLAAAGIGTLGIVDDDVVDLSNLQRQVIHGVSDVGASKLESARDRIAELNPLVRVELHERRLDVSNALEILAGYDLVIDGTDNFASRYLVSDAAEILALPVVWGAISRFDGQVSVFWAANGPTYRDLYPEAPPEGSVPSCAVGGVFGVLCAAIGSAMATEAIKLVTGLGRTLLGRVLIHDALAATWREVTVLADPDRTPVTRLGEPDPATRLCEPDPVARPSGSSVSVRRLAELLEERASGGRDFDLVDVREPGEHNLVHIPGSRLLPLDGILSAGPADPDLPRDRDVLLYCKAGSRSTAALEELGRRGYSRVSLVHGGVLAWVAEIEPHLPAY